MTLPICDICAKTGVLCSTCESKLQEGRISELDVKLSGLLYGLGKSEIGFERAIDTKNFIIVLTRKEDVGKIIGRGGDSIRFLSEKLEKQLRVIGTGDLEQTIYDFVAPARITSINTVYRLDGSTIKRVRIDKRDKKKLRMDLEEIKKLIASLADDNIEIIFG
ncbi:MAG: KH domain-containing protein [Candidatus Altiarchaeales archaeon]|nr:KH domain-containing protein [Candidatus Altiarchaeales archaeon]